MPPKRKAADKETRDVRRARRAESAAGGSATGGERDVRRARAHDEETREARDQAKEEAKLNALQKMKTKRAATRFENLVATIMQKHAMGSTDRMKPDKFAALMKASEKLVDGVSYAECLRSGLYDQCDVVVVQKALETVLDGVEDEDYDKTAYHETCQAIFEKVFPNEDVCEKLSEWLAQAEPRPAGMSLDAYGDQFITMLDVVVWARELYKRPCSTTWHLARTKLFLAKLNCKWLEVQFLPLIEAGKPLDDLIRRIELVTTVRDLDEDRTETERDAPPRLNAQH